MKIGMLVDTYLPIMGGAEIHVLELGRALREQGFEISVCTSTPGSEVGEFPVLRLPVLKGGGWRAVLQVPKILPALARFIRSMDIVHCHYSFLLAALGVLVGRFLGKRTIVTLHGLGTLDSSVERHVLWRLYRYISLKWADGIIATSSEMAGVARRFSSDERITIIPNGVDTRRFSPRTKSGNGELVILSMRRLAPKNGVQYLVEAAPQVVEAVPNARFWITGEGKLESYIRQRVTELGMQQFFHFIGIVQHDQTPEYYSQADIVVFPSSAESTSLACLEAMSMEKPVIASSLAVYKDMLGDNAFGLLVQLFDREESDYNAPLTLPPERIHALAQAVITLLNDSALRSKLGRAARRSIIENYEWRSIAAETARLYSKQGGRD